MGLYSFLDDKVFGGGLPGGSSDAEYLQRQIELTGSTIATVATPILAPVGILIDPFTESDTNPRNIWLGAQEMFGQDWAYRVPQRFTVQEGFYEATDVFTPDAFFNFDADAAAEQAGTQRPTGLLPDLADKLKNFDFSKFLTGALLIIGAFALTRNPR